MTSFTTSVHHEHTPTAGLALVTAGGTGGHIFPGLAVAQALQKKGVQVQWLGAPSPSMESVLVSQADIVFHPVGFSGVRGKGWRVKFLAIFKLVRAVHESVLILRQLKPQVVLGFGGYITFPVGIASWLCRVPLVIHEQNAIAGLSNRCLSFLTKHVYSAFPGAIGSKESASKAWVGNPLRAAFFEQASVKERLQRNCGAVHLPLRLLVVGGSLGAQALNETIPHALALMPEQSRPSVRHQSGAKQVEELKALYARLGVKAEVTPFIDEMAQAMANTDVLIARAGASTVTEVAALGVPTLFVPFPFAVDDHQTHNARFLSERGGAWLVSQKELTPQWLAQWLGSLNPESLIAVGEKAQQLAKLEATQALVQVSLNLMEQSVQEVSS
jgi:UDP-N-acetylglucosamine--N-acetylmuramyl-(pentapeptide) pyrophosphoryl-undecaprenol N-acetylglucosamine transferase